MSQSKNNDVNELLNFLEENTDRLKQSVVHKNSNGKSNDTDNSFSKDLDRQRKQEKIENLKADRKLREKNAEKTFYFMLAVNILGYAYIFIILFSKISNPPSGVFSVLSYSMPASMVLFGWVLRGLFSNK